VCSVLVAPGTQQAALDTTVFVTSTSLQEQFLHMLGELLRQASSTSGSNYEHIHCCFQFHNYLAFWQGPLSHRQSSMKVMVSGLSRAV